MQWNGHHLLFDPYLSDSLTKKYAATDKPHVRISGRVVAPQQLGFVDVVTASHHHTDHLDPETLQPLGQANPRLELICPRAHLALARERSRLDIEQVIGLDPETAPCAAEAGPFHVSALPAAHEALDRDPTGLFQYVGYVVRAGPWTLYHAGDTVLYDGLAERLRSFRPDLALLPINGRAPERRVAGNLWGREAAALAHDGLVRLAVPCHYGLFAFNTASPEAFATECERRGQAYRILELGERLSLPRPDPQPARCS